MLASTGITTILLRAKRNTVTARDDSCGIEFLEGTYWINRIRYWTP